MAQLKGTWRIFTNNFHCQTDSIIIGLDTHMRGVNHLHMWQYDANSEN